MSEIFAHLKAVLQTTPLRWHALADVFPEELLRRRPQPGEWSALECLQHLFDLDRGVFPQRIRAILAGENFPGFVPERDGTPLSAMMSSKALAAEFEVLRRDNLALLEKVTESDLSRTANHSELGEVTMSNLLHEWGGHDLMHLVQAQQALMQPFIAGCGAWEVYFIDHKANVKEA